MARKSIIVAAVVLVLGLISVGAGFAAEIVSAKCSKIRIDVDECVHQCNPVMALAIIAAVTMFLLRVVVRVATGSGYSCCRTLPNVPKLIRYCIILAWFMSFVAVGQFIWGAKNCDKCYAIKPGFFSGAALVALVSMCSTLFYYLVIASAQNVPEKPPGSDVEVPSVANDHLRPPLPPQMR